MCVLQCKTVARNAVLGQHSSSSDHAGGNPASRQRVMASNTPAILTRGLQPQAGGPFLFTVASHMIPRGVGNAVEVGLSCSLAIPVIRNSLKNVVAGAMTPCVTPASIQLASRLEGRWRNSSLTCQVFFKRTVKAHPVPGGQAKTAPKRSSDSGWQLQARIHVLGATSVRIIPEHAEP